VTESPAPAPAARGAVFTLSVLSVVNLFNYLDRYIVAGVLPKVETTFNLGHDEAGLLGTIFMVVYMCASPLGGFLGDRVPRRFLVAGSVFLWSLATAASGLAGSFAVLLIARAVTGIGEAGYGTVAPAMISDLFKKEVRTRVLSFFYAAIPLGAAAGFVLGGTISEHHSWNMAFFVGGAPGLLLAGLALFLAEPKRGAMDEGSPAAKVPFGVGIRQLSKNRMFWLATAGQTAMTFSIGGLAYWMPTFLEKERGMSGTTAGLALGAVTVVAGLLGTLVGGVLGDWLDRRRPHGGLRLSGWGLALAAPLMVGAALSTTPLVLFTCLFAAQFLVFLNNGPLNAAVVNAVPPAFRAFAVGVNIFCIHLFGDAASPTAIGWVGKVSTLGTAIEVNALPVLLGGVVLLLGLRFASAPPAATATAAP
jgi:MFS family permease